jgi:hypothetical protein
LELLLWLQENQHVIHEECSMTTYNRLAALKQITGLVGVAGVSTFICLPAWAQLHPNPGMKNSSFNERVLDVHPTTIFRALQRYIQS